MAYDGKGFRILHQNYMSSHVVPTRSGKETSYVSEYAYLGSVRLVHVDSHSNEH